jgi:SAM-dependent methyltransferase
MNFSAKTHPYHPDLLFPRDYLPEDGVLVRADAAAPGHDYNDGDEFETRIAAILRATEDRSVFSPALQNGITDWPSRYHLSSRRANLLRPFAAAIAGKHVLEVGAGCGAISRYLGELASGPAGGSIVSLESSLRRAGIARLRTKDLPAVQVVCDDVFRLRPEHLFDVIVVVGALEYSRLFYSGAGNAEQALLDRLARLLQPGGLLLLAIENQLGLKYLAGVPEDHLGRPYEGVEDRYSAHTPVTFGHEELGNLLRRAGFASQRTYLPFPDYKVPSVIISPLGATRPDFQAGALAAEAVNVAEYTRFSLQSSWPLVARNGLLQALSNSFLIAANTAGPCASEAATGVLAWYFNVDRAPSFKKETRFVADAANGGRIEVVRETLCPLATAPDVPVGSHFVTETYLPRETWWSRLIPLIGRQGWTLAELAEWSSVWLDALCAQAGGGSLVADRLVDGSLVDATPFNLIVQCDGTAVFFDQEWHAKPQLPLGFIATRGLRDSVVRIAHIARPAHSELYSVDRIVQATLTRLGMLLTPSDFERYAELEIQLQAWVAGAILPGETDCAAAMHRKVIRWHGQSPEDEAAIEEERRQHAAAQDNVCHLTAQLAAQESREANELARLQAQLAAQGNELAGLQTQLAAQESGEANNLARLQAQIAAQERREHLALQQMRGEVAAMQDRSLVAEQTCRLIQESRTWRITKPLRTLADNLPARLRRLLRRSHRRQADPRS